MPKIISLVTAELKPERLVLRLSRNIQGAARGFKMSDGQILSGPPLEGPVIFLENGLTFEAEVVRGQKTGFFLDQRENRFLVGTMASEREVLNTFSFSGAFSVYAARGGAKSVVDLDISRHALESARRNFALNAELPGVGRCASDFIQADAFDWLENNDRRKFGMIILDPPSLAKREREQERALQAYEKLAMHAIAALHPDGILVAASCSAHVPVSDFFEAVRRASSRSGRQWQELRTTGHPTDHPATFPEAQYLKCIYLKFE